MKIDVFTHILPLKFMDRLEAMGGRFYNKQVNEACPTLWDIERRLRIMDRFDDLVQVLTLATPPIELIAGPDKAGELARIANDGLAELVARYPDRFVAAVASLPMNDMDAALREADRAIRDLKFRGVQIFTPSNGKPLDSPEFFPLYERMAEARLPIWIHPVRGHDTPDYPGETSSRYYIYGIFGWPYETTSAVTRLIFSGVFERYPQLKVITHHCGGMIPFFAERLNMAYDLNEMRMASKVKQRLSRPVLDYYRMIYADTAVPSPGALRCGCDFFGPGHLLFGTDMPYDNQLGYRFLSKTIDAILQLELPERDKSAIFEENARSLLRLPA